MLSYFFAGVSREGDEGIAGRGQAIPLLRFLTDGRPRPAKFVAGRIAPGRVAKNA